MHKTRSRCGGRERSKTRHKRCRRANIDTSRIPEPKELCPKLQPRLLGAKKDAEVQATTQEAQAGQRRDDKHPRTQMSSIAHFDLDFETSKQKAAAQEAQVGQHLNSDEHSPGEPVSISGRW